MDALAMYGSDEEKEGDRSGRGKVGKVKKTMSTSEAGSTGRGTREAPDINYDEVKMDMSEESQSDFDTGSAHAPVPPPESSPSPESALPSSNDSDSSSPTLPPPIQHVPPTSKSTVSPIKQYQREEGRRRRKRGRHGGSPKNKGRSRSPSPNNKGKQRSQSPGRGRGRSQSPAHKGKGRSRSQSPASKGRGRSQSPPNRGKGRTPEKGRDRKRSRSRDRRDRQSHRDRRRPRSRSRSKSSSPSDRKGNRRSAQQSRPQQGRPPRHSRSRSRSWSPRRHRRPFNGGRKRGAPPPSPPEEPIKRLAFVPATSQGLPTAPPDQPAVGVHLPANPAPLMSLPPMAPTLATHQPGAGFHGPPMGTTTSTVIGPEGVPLIIQHPPPLPPGMARGPPLSGALAGANLSKVAQQMSKRKLLWGHKEKETAASSSSNHWEGTRFAQDDDGRMSAKFKRLMGIKGGEEEDHPKVVEKVPEKVPEPKPSAGGEDLLRRQEEMFQSMERQYEAARAATHTQRGLGLGFSSAFHYQKP